MSAFDVTTFVTEGVENDERIEHTLEELVARGIIEPFPDGMLTRPVSSVMGRDGIEVLVNRNFRVTAASAFKRVKYTLVEGERE